LASSLVVAVVNYRDIIYAKNSELATRQEEIQNLNERNSQLQSWLNSNVTKLGNEIAELQSEISRNTDLINNYEEQITGLEEQTHTLDAEIYKLNFQVDDLENAIIEYTEMLNLNRKQLRTLVFHVCEKDWIQVPDINATYNLLVDFFGGQYNILLLPEYHEQQNWTQKLDWLNASFGGPDGIPIMLEVFGGGGGTKPTPMLSISEIEDAIAVANVKYLRIFEVISWHMENNQTFPVDYINEVLEFAQANYVKVFWTEWKNDLPPKYEVFQAIQNYIQGYENIVTVSFSTNSGELEPGAGFLQLDGMFKRWGASIQSWYWNTQHGENPEDMPASLLVQHTLIASYVGAELIQFEPYWYFFDEDGQPTENLILLQNMLVW
jgi:hypothetical protein